LQSHFLYARITLISITFRGLFRFAIVNVTIRNTVPFIFSFHIGQTPIPFYGDLRSSGDWFKFPAFRFRWFWKIIISTNLTLLLSLHLYSSFTLDCFTLLVVLPKNKIHSIINSFKSLNNEQPRLLIFLYCIVWNF